MKRWIAVAVVTGLGASAMAMAQRERLPAECRQEIMQLCRGAEGGQRQCLRTVLPKMSDKCRKIAAEQSAAREERPDGMVEIAYGADPKQKIDLMVPAGASEAPILFYVHGGGWSIGDKAAGAAKKGPWATGQGWAYVSANYRLVPQATVEQQAADLANALAWLRANARARGLDPDRIVLMGHSAGAHLVALLGTDTSYLNAAGVPVGAVRGVVLLDGAGYDVAKQMRTPGNLVQPMYDAAFGSDTARQKRLSPTLQTGKPNVANWLILPVERRNDSVGQSQGLAAALHAAGASAVVRPVPDESHMTLNKGFGEKGDLATEETERFMASLR